MRAIAYRISAAAQGSAPSRLSRFPAGWCRLSTSAKAIPIMSASGLAGAWSGHRSRGFAGAPGQLSAVVGPDTLAPVAVTAGLAGQQVEQRAAVAGVAGRHGGGRPRTPAKPRLPPHHAPRPFLCPPPPQRLRAPAPPPLATVVPSA